jgi:hypothetical protein
LPRVELRHTVERSLARLHIVEQQRSGMLCGEEARLRGSLLPLQPSAGGRAGLIQIK